MNLSTRNRARLTWLLLSYLTLKLSGLGHLLGTLTPGYAWFQYYRDNSGEVLSLLLKDNPLQRCIWTWLHTPTLASIRFCLSQVTTTPVIYQPDAWIVGTSTFAVKVFPYCSGLEGLFLLTAGISLLCWRQPVLWRHWAWLVLLAGTLCWLAAVLRLTLLILLGNQFPAGAMANHFHAEAGWLLLLGLWLLIRTLCCQLRSKLPESQST